MYWHVHAPSTAAALPSSPIAARSLSQDMNSATYAPAFHAEVMETIRLNSDKTTLLSELQKRENWRDKDFAFDTSARAAMRDRPKDALPVIYAEL